MINTPIQNARAAVVGCVAALILAMVSALIPAIPQDHKSSRPPPNPQLCLTFAAVFAVGGVGLGFVAASLRKKATESLQKEFQRAGAQYYDLGSVLGLPFPATLIASRENLYFII